MFLLCSLFQLYFETFLSPLLFLITLYYLSLAFFVFFSMLLKKSFLHILPFLYHFFLFLLFYELYSIIFCRKIQYFLAKNYYFILNLLPSYFSKKLFILPFTNLLNEIPVFSLIAINSS